MRGGIPKPVSWDCLEAILPAAKSAGEFCSPADIAVFAALRLFDFCIIWIILSIPLDSLVTLPRAGVVGAGAVGAGAVGAVFTWLTLLASAIGVVSPTTASGADCCLRSVCVRMCMCRVRET